MEFIPAEEDPETGELREIQNEGAGADEENDDSNNEDSARQSGFGHGCDDSLASLRHR